MESGTILLSLIIWTPLVGALLVLLVPRDQPEGARRAALAFSVVPLLLSLALWAGFRTDVGDVQWVENVPWIPSFGISISSQKT